MTVKKAKINVNNTIELYRTKMKIKRLDSGNICDGEEVLLIKLEEEE